MDIEIKNNLKQVNSFSESKCSDMDFKLRQLSDKLIDTDNLHECLRIALTLAYNIVQYRVMLNDEIAKLRALSVSNVSDASKALAKKYEANYRDRYDRLIELRHDLELVQKLSFNNKIV